MTTRFFGALARLKPCPTGSRDLAVWLLLGVLAHAGAADARAANIQPARDERAAVIPAASAKAQVSIDNFSFKERVLTVSPGTEVTWINHDDAPHKIVSVDKTTFSSPVLDTDGRFSFTFTRPGVYEYFCSIHPMMTGKIVVK